MTTPLDHLWQALESLERQQRHPPPQGVVRDGGWFDEWQARLNRVQHVRSALAMSGPTALRIITERLPGIELGAIGQVLLAACKDVAAVAGGSALLGGAAGAALGSLAGGVGAIPGGLAGAGVGLQAATWVMGVLGLKELVQDLAEAVPQALRHYERGIRMAWGPVKVWEMPDRPEQAHYELAEGHIVLLGAILAALAAYLTRGRGDPAARARLLQEIRQSPRLGPQVADWVAANEDKLIAHPGLRPKTQQVTMASAPAKDVGPPATPSQLRRQREAGSDGDGRPPEPMPSGAQGSVQLPEEPTESKTKPRRPRQPRKSNSNIDHARTVKHADGSTTYFDKQGRAVTYNKDGFPDFGPYAEADVKVVGLKGSIPPDDGLANMAVGLKSTPDGYTWHHVEDKVTMQLVPTDVHATFPHSGGASAIRNGT
jgi:hypothetical protein